MSVETFEAGPCTSEEDLDQRLSQYAFLEYASFHGGHHFAAIQGHKKIALALRLLEDENALASSVQILYLPRHRTYGWHDLFPREFTSLHAIAYWGLEELFTALSPTDMVIDSQDSLRATPLNLASQRGHVRMMQLLLEKEAGPDIINYHHETALVSAARGGHKPVVELLLVSGADPMI